MTGSSTLNIPRGRSFLIALVLASGCAHSTTDLRDSLAERIMPVDAEVSRPTLQPQAKSSDRAPTDEKVQPAAASNPVQASADKNNDAQSAALPPALAGPSRPRESNQATAAAMPLPKDSDEATLDAIATLHPTGTDPVVAAGLSGDGKTVVMFRLSPVPSAELSDVTSGRTFATLRPPSSALAEILAQDGKGLNKAGLLQSAGQRDTRFWEVVQSLAPTAGERKVSPAKE